MPICNSWRYVDGVPDHRLHFPVGRNHACWKPCWNRIHRGETRCRDCADSLIMCPNSKVRRALVAEPNQTEYVLTALTTDSNGDIAADAENYLAALTRDALTISPFSNSLWS